MRKKQKKLNKEIREAWRVLFTLHSSLFTLHSLLFTS